ncbi:MAG: DUF4080 domain-containing protein [Campylobacterota bacterium]|nr:DUF4080 domain-containing protein [Campylobacterota bacterium]
MTDIILTTLNGRYSHSAIGLRYLYANLKELQPKSLIKEYVIKERMQDIALSILSYKPKIVAIGVYIWNVTDVYELVHIIKKVSPNTIVVLGGPEASYEPFRVDLTIADHIIQGEGEVQFYELCRDLLDNKTITQKIFPPKLLDLKNVNLPYEYYNENDVEHRYIYVEASRGCPFSCEFCLSSIDKKVRNFDIDKLLKEFEILWQKGVRNYKFIDRTFNLNIKYATKLIEFFLEKDEPYTVHFEVIPDNFPEKLREKIKQFPPGALQLEIGIQTLKEDIARNIKRNLNIPKIKENISFLENETNAHIHLDLIIGLPGETIESFGENLDYLCNISSSEVQVGVLKKLSGTTLNRHDEVFGMVYSEIPPYDILCNDHIPFEKMQHMKRFARYWDLVYNSGNFIKTFKNMVKEKSVYKTFDQFTAWLYEQTYSTWQISLDRLAKFLFDFMCEVQAQNKEQIAAIMVEDILRVGGRKLPSFLRQYSDIVIRSDKVNMSGKNKRQMKRMS